jgi:hypothetical protein
MNIDVEELKEYIEYLDAYLYDDASLSDKKIEKIRDILSDIVEELEG